MLDYTEEDVGNIVSLEHVNLQVPDQAIATLLHCWPGVDPRSLSECRIKTWANIGEQQFHLPTRAAQKICGYIGLVMPDLAHSVSDLPRCKNRLRVHNFSLVRP